MSRPTRPNAARPSAATSTEPASPPQSPTAPASPTPASPSASGPTSLRELNLEFDRKRAKELLRQWKAGEPEALERLQRHLPAENADHPTLALAQMVVAREQGFASWPRLKQHILWPHFQSAVIWMDRGEMGAVQELIGAHPELLKLRAPHPAGETPGYFSGAMLLHHVAGNPYRGTLPPNIAAIAAALLQAGADANAHTLGGSTTVGLVLTSRAASEAGVAAGLLDVLKAHGARDNVDAEEPVLLALRNCAPETALSLWRRGNRIGLRAAAGLGLKSQVQEFLENHLATLSPAKRQEELDEALNYASAHGQNDVIPLLLLHGADIDSFPAVFGNVGTALHVATRLDTARLLVEHGANLYRRDPNFGGTPADWADHEANEAVSQYLRGLMAPPTPDLARDNTPQDTALVRRVVLTDPGAPEPEKHDVSFLFDAASAGDLDALRQILRANPELISARTAGTERTALHLAASGGSVDTVKLLLEHGADFYARDAHEQLPLDVAPGAAMTAAHMYLRSLNDERNRFLGLCAQSDTQGAAAMLATNAHLVRARDIAEGTPPLIYAACKENPDLIRLLLQHGADPNQREWSTNWSPLAFCAENGHEGNMRALVAGGADPALNWPVAYGRTKMQMNGLHLSTWKGHTNLVRLFLEAGLPVNGRARSYALFTPLHFAATEGNLEMVKLLIEAGADAGARDGRRGINALEMARAGNHQAVTVYLEGLTAKP